jgi:hypothetical protein
MHKLLYQVMVRNSEVKFLNRNAFLIEIKRKIKVKKFFYQTFFLNFEFAGS